MRQHFTSCNYWLIFSFCLDQFRIIFFYSGRNYNNCYINGWFFVLLQFWLIVTIFIEFSLQYCFFSVLTEFGRNMRCILTLRITCESYKAYRNKFIVQYFNLERVCSSPSPVPVQLQICEKMIFTAHSVSILYCWLM